MGKNNLLWVSIIILVIIDVISYFTAGTTKRNLSVNIPLFITFMVGVLLLFYSLKDHIKKNKKGAVMGCIIGFILGALSYGMGMFILFFLLPIYGLIQNIVGCAGENCLGLFIILSPIILSLTGILLGSLFLKETKK